MLLSALLSKVPIPSAETTIARFSMRPKTTSFLIRSLILTTVLAPLCLLSGCSDEAHTTGTLATRPPGAEEAQKRSIEYMKSNMKNFQKK
jgi:hypothetical protein